MRLFLIGKNLSSKKEVTLNIVFLITLLLYGCLPLFFLYWIYKSKTTNSVQFFLNILLVSSYLLNIFLIGNWAMFQLAFLRYPMLFMLIFVIYSSYKKHKREWTLRPFKVRTSIGRLFSLSFFLLFSYQAGQAIIGRLPPKNAIDFSFPLEGKNYCVVQGGNHLVVNHHQGVSAQKYALDIVKVDCLGRRAKAWIPKKLEDFFVYESRVLSPCKARVVKAEDKLDDQAIMKMDSEHICGNSIVLYLEEKKLYVVLAHLKKESLLVKEGDLVKEGQPLALVGNSGHTSEPHLHIHCVRSQDEDYLFEGQGIPITFNGKFLVRNHKSPKMVQRKSHEV